MDKQKELQVALSHLQFIPESDHEEATKIMTQAVELGWSSIGFWEGWKEVEDEYGEKYHEPMPAELCDMYGVNPKSGLGGFINQTVLDKHDEPYVGPTIDDFIRDMEKGYTEEELSEMKRRFEKTEL